MIKNDFSIWRYLTKIAVGLVVLAVALLIVMEYQPLIDENVRMRHDILKLQDQIKEQQAVALDYSNQIMILRNDPKTIERLTREKLGYARPDETVIHFETSPTNP